MSSHPSKSNPQHMDLPIKRYISLLQCGLQEIVGKGSCPSHNLNLNDVAYTRHWMLPNSQIVLLDRPMKEETWTPSICWWWLSLPEAAIHSRFFIVVLHFLLNQEVAYLFLGRSQGSSPYVYQNSPYVYQNSPIIQLKFVVFQRCSHSRKTVITSEVLIMHVLNTSKHVTRSDQKGNEQTAQILQESMTTMNLETQIG